jgi:hypothetical protein
MSGTDAGLEPAGYVMVAFPVGQADFSGEVASELAALMENTVRVLGLLLLTKDVDGSVQRLSCARPTAARPAGSPACLGTWDRIGDGSRANVRCPRCRSACIRRNARWMKPAARVREREAVACKAMK